MARSKPHSLALPQADPRSQRIRACLAGLPPDADVSAELRRLIVEGLDRSALLARLDRIAARLDQIAAQGISVAPVTPEHDSAAVQAALNTMLDFDHI